MSAQWPHLIHSMCFGHTGHTAVEGIEELGKNCGVVQCSAVVKRSERVV